MKFLNKFHLYIGLMRQRGTDINRLTTEKFETDIVNQNFCNTNWPICLYDFLYKDKKEPYFRYRTNEIEIVDDYFGTKTGENVQAKTNSEISFQHADTSFEELLIERNMHI